VEQFEKKYYKISEVADIIGLPTSTLRFWESRFTIISPRRNRNGTRFYTPSDVEKIRMVAYLVKEKGLHLDAAQDELRNNHTGVSRHSAAVNRLHEIRNQLQTLLDSLNSLR
jgi:DNA-binding transcriptional MerR regulator